jgi:hypothetical protein
MQMTPDEFWRLTYAEFYSMFKGFNRRQVQKRNELLFHAWHAELFARQKKLPELASIIQDDEPQEQRVKQSDDEMMAICKILNAAFGGEVVEL